MVNGSFVFGMDEDDASVFDRTVEWAVGQGVETATFHILTPYPGTLTFQDMEAQGQILHRDWDLYDTRHTVFRPARLQPAANPSFPSILTSAKSPEGNVPLLSATAT